MSEPKFTKGPWYADKYGKIWRNVPSDLYEYGGKIAGDMPLAFVNRGWYEKDETPYPQQANANLITAAPDMYEALYHLLIAAQKVCDDFCCGAGCSQDARDCKLEGGLIRAEIALRKARGIM